MMRLVNRVSLSVMALFTILAYQNCGPAFSVSENSNSASSSELQAIAEGKALYTSSCASCHGELAISTKRDKSVFEITNAIKVVSQMSALNLNSDQLAKISFALSSSSNPAVLQKKFTCVDPRKRGAANPAIRRMSGAEIRTTASALLGTAILRDAEIRKALAQIPSDELVNVKEYNQFPSDEIASVLLTIADRIVVMTSTDVALQSALFGRCVKTDEACAKAFIANYGRRIFRRPLTESENEKYLNIYKNAGGGLVGFQSVLFVFVQAPQMAFHVEEGSTHSNGRTRLSDYEIANRISYRTTGAPPDVLLSRAADRPGELQDLNNVKAHVARLVVSSQVTAKAQINSFFRFYSGLGEITDPSPVIAKARGISTTGGLGAKMLMELEEYTQGIFWKPTGDFKDFMTSSDSYPSSEGLRIILGTQTEIVKPARLAIPSPTHVGFLHRPALLTNEGGRTNPVLRGAHLRQRYLCESIPEPPLELVAQTVVEIGDIEAQTNRAKYEQLTSSANCIGCHALINPVGFAFEGFDPLGMPRKTEIVYSDTGSVVANYGVNTRVMNPKLEIGEAGGTAVSDSIEMANAIATGVKGRSCFAQRTYEFMALRDLNPADDSCVLSDLEDTAKSATLKDVYINSIANEDIFWRKSVAN